ncbi:Tigger transposable element-derived protein 6 [Phytophthora palmivora]|uniref:Tigger transposable element-derived protein 6 n=1 Tax=Phytophthora palmivora TaxID=4796 RepID=A0A2P4WYB9_9STRA|nr:Tigger transposable element-derived protein 6 [Phytophthora palmivora]
MSSVHKGCLNMQKLTDMYALRDIYNTDETSFSYHQESPRTLSKRSKVQGRKADKTRITLAVATNADGSDKLPNLLFRWLHALDLRMRNAQRHILLLVDNVSSHIQPLSPLTNVRLGFLPKNTTSVLQPLDQGIILCIKRGFSNIKEQDSVQRYLKRLPEEKISIFTAMHWAKMSWDKVKPESIRNCWLHSGIVSTESSPMSMRRILRY